MTDSTGDRGATAAAYFDMLAEMGVTKHVGSMDATRGIIEGCGIDRESVVLDVGCGIGLTPCFLASHYGCRVVGLDITPKMIARARDEARRRKVASRVRFVIGDGQALPFAAGQFDAVVVESVTVFFNDRALGFREYARVAREGGYVGVTESTWLAPPGEDAAAFMGSIGGEPLEKDAWVALMEQAGLTVTTAWAKPVDVGVEARGRMERFGVGGMLRLTVHAFAALLSGRAPTAVLKDAMATAPRGIMKQMGYGVYVGRKGPSS